jgi:ABC-type cobalamin transport system permease subunit
MTVFLGALGLLLGLLVMLAGAITFVRGLPAGVELRPGRPDPRGNRIYLLNQESLGGGVVLLALDVVLRLGNRPFLAPGLCLLAIPFFLRAARPGRRQDRASRPKRERGGDQ